MGECTPGPQPVGSERLSPIAPNSALRNGNRNGLTAEVKSLAECPMRGMGEMRTGRLVICIVGGVLATR